MTAQEFLHAGKLEEALAALTQEVRAKPADSKLRVFLFQLLAVHGQWERALTQLEVAGQMDPSALPMVQTYRDALVCEALRTAVFAGERAPLVFGEPQQWLALLLQALTLDASARHAEAQALREQAFEAAPVTAGSIDGQRFEWIADADGRLGPVLEVLLRGRYYWVPFHRLKRVRLEAPADLRDVVWTPVYLTLSNGGETVGLIPTRYAGSETSSDSSLRLARKTEWIERTADLYEGRGQRLLATDAGEHALMDVREIMLDTEPDAQAAAEGALGEAGGG